MKTYDIYFSGVIAIQDRIEAESSIEAISKFFLKWNIVCFCFYLECTEIMAEAKP